MVFNDKLIIFIIFFHVLGLIKTLFSIIIQGLFGSEFGLTNKSFGSVFVCEWKSKAHKGRFIRVNFLELLKHL